MTGVVCWGFTPVILRRLTTFIDAWTANGVRYAFSAALYWPLLYLALRSGRLNFALLRRCLIPAVFALGGQIFWALSYYELQASEVGFLVRLSMFWSIVGSMILFRDERQLLRNPGFYVGVFLVGAGFIAMSMLDGPMPTHSATDQTAVVGNHQLGVLFILLCAALFGSYVVSVRSCIADVNPFLAFGIVANLVSVGTLIGMFWKGDPSILSQQTAFSWLLLGASSLLGIAIGHIMMYVAVQRLGAAITSSCQTLMPFVTAAAASVLLSERLTGQQWLGGIVMVAGAIILLSLKLVVSDNPNAAAGD